MRMYVVPEVRPILVLTNRGLSPISSWIQKVRIVPVCYVLLEGFWYTTFIAGGAPHKERRCGAGETREN